MYDNIQVWAGEREEYEPCLCLLISTEWNATGQVLLKLFLICECNAKLSYLENELCSNKQIDQGKETQHT